MTTFNTQGTLIVRSSSEKSKCKEISVCVTGKGHTKFKTGSGEDEETHYHSQIYANCKNTVWGNVYSTPVLDDAGENAVFGSQWAPDEGVLSFTLKEEQQHQVIILRVMNSAWIREDDVLMELLLDTREYANNGQQKIIVRKGSSVITFSMGFVSGQSTALQIDKVLRLQVFSVTGLRSANFLTKNHVYVQAYAAPLNVNSNTSPLPAPVANIPLPRGNLEVPFTLQLPADLPSTFTLTNGKPSDNYIEYTLSAKIDVGWPSNVTAKTNITVLQGTSSATMPMRQPLNMRVSDEMRPRFCCCACPCLGSVGQIQVEANTDRTGYAPGEKVQLALHIECTPPKAHDRIMNITAQLMMLVTLRAEGEVEKFSRSCGPLLVRDKNNREDILYTIPSVPPTYTGGLGKQNIDPIVWSYELVVTVNISVPGFLSVSNMHAGVRLPVVLTGRGLTAADTNYFASATSAIVAPSAPPASRDDVTVTNSLWGGEVAVMESEPLLN